jgi:hypothetical protein
MTVPKRFNSWLTKKLSRYYSSNSTVTGVLWRIIFDAKVFFKEKTFEV